MVDTSINLPRRYNAGVGTFQPSGLSREGKITIQSINNSGWTALPASALSGRNALSILNDSGQDVVLNYDNSISGYIGYPLRNGAERRYDIKDTIVIYAKSAVSTCDLILEELA